MANRKIASKVITGLFVLCVSSAHATTGLHVMKGLVWLLVFFLIIGLIAVLVVATYIIQYSQTKRPDKLFKFVTIALLLFGVSFCLVTMYRTYKCRGYMDVMERSLFWASKIK